MTRRRAQRPLVLEDPERQERNEAYTKAVRARGDYRPQRKDGNDDRLVHVRSSSRTPGDGVVP